MPDLRLWLENDGRTAHLINEAGLPVVSGALVPVEGAAQLADGAESGTVIRTELRFEGTVR